MVAALPLNIWTEEDYLEYQKRTEVKHEYLRGLVYAMAGASPSHIRIVGNIFASLRAQVGERNCEIFASEMQVKVEAAELFAYPDVVAVCGEAQFAAGNVAILLNPTLIIEVLSPSTAAYDSGGKFQNYRLLDSLQEYLLVSQDEARIERYLKQEDGAWLLTDAIGLDATLELPSIECTLALNDVYAKVEFETSSGE